MSPIKISNVLLLDGIDSTCGDILKKAGVHVTSKAKLTKDELLEIIKDFDALVVRSATKVTADVLAAGKRLVLVGRAGTGVDNIDVEAATRKGVLVMNTPGGNTISAAEHTCALLCSLPRTIPQACASLKGGAWDRKRFLGTELSGKTLAVIGLGRIGREVASRMQSFGMTVIGYDPFVSAATAAQWNIEALELKQIWPRADYITVHTPLLPHTRNLIGDEVLSLCKRGVKVVNVARGGIVDEVALLAALEDGRCGGAALDVFVNEPPTDFTLCQHPKVICTPHLGAMTVEAQKRVAVEIAEQIVQVVCGGPLDGLVNGQSLAQVSDSAAAAWVTLAEALGKLLAKLTPAGTQTNVTVNCHGTETARLAKVMAAAVQVGLLHTCNTVNLVNAAVLAKDKGLNVMVQQLPGLLPAIRPSGVQQCLSVSSSGTTLLGCVSNSHAVLLAVDDCSFNATGVSLSGSNLLFYRSAAATAPPLAAVASLLQDANAGLLSVVATAAGRKDVWVVGCTARQVESPGGVKNGKFVTQVAF